MRVELLGLKELDALFGELPQSFRRKVALAALRKASKPMVTTARARAPRGKNPFKRGSKKQRQAGKSALIGHGADSIKFRALPASDPNKVEAGIGPDSAHFYLRFSEFKIPRQRQQAFLVPTFELHKASVVEAVGVALFESIAATARRHVRKLEKVGKA